MGSPLERLWKDKMDIYRWIDTVVNNITKSAEQKLYSNIKCHYSGGSLVETSSDAVPSINNSHILFCSSSTDLINGDKIIVTQRNGNIISLSVGEGFPYKDCLQFSVKRSDTV